MKIREKRYLARKFGLTESLIQIAENGAKAEGSRMMNAIHYAITLEKLKKLKP